MCFPSSAAARPAGIKLLADRPSASSALASSKSRRALASAESEISAACSRVSRLGGVVARGYVHRPICIERIVCPAGCVSPPARGGDIALRSRSWIGVAPTLSPMGPAEALVGSVFANEFVLAGDGLVDDRGPPIPGSQCSSCGFHRGTDEGVVNAAAADPSFD